MRTGLVGIGLATLVLGCVSAQEGAPAGPKAPAALPEQHALLSGGPMLGYTALRSATVWLQAKGPCTAQLRVHPQGQPEKARLSAAIALRADDDFAHTFLVDTLEPKTTYAYELYLDGQRVNRPYPLTFTTRTLWQHRTDPPELKVMLGSCAFVNEKPYDRPGKGYGGDYPIFRAMSQEGADAMLWLGDNVYLREVDYSTREGILRRYRHTRGLPELQALLAAQPNYALWDDHDYGPDNSDRGYSLKGPSLETFRRFWPAPNYGLPDTPGAFQKFELADADVFFLDNRYYRTPNKIPNGPAKTQFGAKQLQWLLDGLASSRATFKIVATGNQVFNLVSPWEGTHKAADLEKITAFIEAQKIEGVLFLSGDRHHTELLVRKKEGCYPLYDWTNSPMTSGVYPLREGDVEFEHPNRVAGSLLEVRNYGTLQFRGPRKERSLVLSAKGVGGETLWEHTLTRKELSFAK